MALTTTTTAASTVQTIWLKKLMAVAKGYLVTHKWADTDKIIKHSGDTITVNLMRRLPKVTSTSSSGTRFDIANAKATYTDKREYTIDILQDVIGVDDVVDVVGFLKNKQYRDNVAQQMANSQDYYIANKLATQGIRVRADRDSTYTVSGTVDASSTETALIDSALTQADDFWNGGYVGYYEPTGGGYDEVSEVTDFVASSDTATVSFTNAPTVGTSKYLMTVGTNIAATDKLTHAGILYVSALHESFETMKLDGGTFTMLVSPAQKADLWTDTTFLDSAIHDDSGRFDTYTPIRWMDHNLVTSSNLRREDTDGTLNSGGIVYCTPSLGKNAYSIWAYDMDGGSGIFGTNLYLLDKADKYDPTGSQKHFVWKSMVTAGVKKATSDIVLLTGATPLGLDG